MPRTTKSVTITARITPALNKKLNAYAKAARRSKSWLIEDILDRFVDSEIAIVEAVQEGIAAIDRGEFHTTEDVFGALRAKSERRRRALRRKAA
jgi:predicted transcriptional regulator